MPGGPRPALSGSSTVDPMRHSAPQNAVYQRETAVFRGIIPLLLPAIGVCWGVTIAGGESRQPANAIL